MSKASTLVSYYRVEASSVFLLNFTSFQENGQRVQLLATPCHVLSLSKILMYFLQLTFWHTDIIY